MVSLAFALLSGHLTSAFNKAYAWHRPNHNVLHPFEIWPLWRIRLRNKCTGTKTRFRSACSTSTTVKTQRERPSIVAEYCRLLAHQYRRSCPDAETQSTFTQTTTCFARSLAGPRGNLISGNCLWLGMNFLRPSHRLPHPILARPLSVSPVICSGSNKAGFRVQLVESLD